MVADKQLEFIVDSSVFIAYLLPDETLPHSITSVINKFIKNQADFIAPTILKYEIGNALKSSVKQKRVEAAEALEIFETFLEFPIHFLSPNYSKTLQLSIQHNLTFYDASYLCLAQEKKVKLLTLDKKLLTCLPK